MIRSNVFLAGAGIRALILMSSRPLNADPLTITVLNKELGTSYAYASQIVASLLRKNLIKTDRKGRSVFITLTETGSIVGHNLAVAYMYLDDKPKVRP